MKRIFMLCVACLAALCLKAQTWTATVPAGSYVNVLSLAAGQWGQEVRGFLSIDSTFPYARTQATYSVCAMGSGNVNAVSLMSIGLYTGGNAPFKLIESGYGPLGGGSMMINLYNSSSSTETITYTLTLDATSAIPTYYNNPTPVSGLPDGHTAVFGSFYAPLEASNINAGGLQLSSPNSIDLQMFSSAVGGYSRLFFGAGTFGQRWNVGQRDDNNGIFSIEGDSNGGGAWGSRLAITLAGNVGIGTTNPSTLLDIGGVPAPLGTAGNVAVRAGHDMNLLLGGNGTPGTFFIRAGLDDNSNYSSLTIQGRPLILNPYGSGMNVGIGTTTPGAKLDVNGDIRLPQSNSLFFDTSNGSFIRQVAGGALDIDASVAAGNGNITISPASSNGLYLNYVGGSSVFFCNGSATPVNVITSNGSMGIATLTVPSNYKLAVAGNAIAESMTVKLQANWPDYAFKKNYKLMPLSELKTYVDKNQHLPEVPSAEQIKKDGINLGEMNRLLLKKVEELTLYLMEMKKDNELLNQRIIKLENKK